jgi:hypothetical protein
LVVTLLTGVPGDTGPQGPQGPQGPPGTATSISGDIVLSLGEEGTIATVVGFQSQPVSSNVPTENQVFQFSGTEWVPTNFTAGTY